MKRRFLAIALCCSMLFSALGTTASAHTTLSGIGHSPSETHWDIFEDGYEIKPGSPFPYHSSGNGIMIKASYDIKNTSCFSNIDDRILHAVSAWSNAVFNGQKIFSGKIYKVDSSYSLTSSDKANEKTLVEVISENDESGDYWAVTLLNWDENMYYPQTSSGIHVGTCKIKLNERTLGSKGSEIYENYTLTHELGHVIGLADLSSKFNDGTFSNYLMGYNNWTMQKPTATDIKGAAVISGYHTNHSNYNYVFYNNTYHKESCGLCDGYNLKEHTISRGKCTSCNQIVARETDTWKVFDGPLNVRKTASTAAYSYGTIANGTTFKINDIKVSGNYIFAKISSISSLANGSTCSAANAVGHWVAIEYCAVV